MTSACSSLQVLAQNTTAPSGPGRGRSLKNIGGTGAADNTGIVIKAPDIAENGAVVPVDVSSSIPNTISLAVLVDKNPLPLSAAFDFTNGALPELALRLKLGQTSLIEVVPRQRRQILKPKRSESHGRRLRRLVPAPESRVLNETETTRRKTWQIQ
jgi:predicted secreted protein